jgi:hypothetical protein
VRNRGDKLRFYILDHVAEHTREFARQVFEAFDISRQAVNVFGGGRLVDEQGESFEWADSPDPGRCNPTERLIGRDWSKTANR